MKRYLLIFGMVLIIIFNSSILKAETLPKNDRFDLQTGIRLIILGDKHNTGGPMPVLGILYNYQVSNSIVDINTGAAVGIFGFDGNSHWVSGLGGISIGITASITEYAKLGISESIEYGRVSVCNNWNPSFCARYWGLYPRTQATIGYILPLKKCVKVSFGFAGQYFKTSGWTGISWEPALFGSYCW